MTIYCSVKTEFANTSISKCNRNIVLCSHPKFVRAPVILEDKKEFIDFLSWTYDNRSILWEYTDLLFQKRRGIDNIVYHKTQLILIFSLMAYSTEAYVFNNILLPFGQPNSRRKIWLRNCEFCKVSGKTLQNCEKYLHYWKFQFIVCICRLSLYYSEETRSLRIPGINTGAFSIYCHVVNLLFYQAPFSL